MSRSGSDSRGGCGSTLLGCLLVCGGAGFLAAVLMAMSPGTRGCAEGCARTVLHREVVSVTIPEGWNRFQIASRLAHAGVVASEREFLAATEDPDLARSLGLAQAPVEGFLFPDTYELRKGAAPDVVVMILVLEFEREFRRIEKKHPDGIETLKRLGADPVRIAVTLASIVELETADRAERRLVAGVFLNRLLLKQFPTRRLQADPTVSYGCVAAKPRPPSCEGWGGKLGRTQLEDAANPYNTYVYGGLPPGPIGNPGRESLEAVLDPEATEYLYFVSKGDGSHKFSKTLEEHNEAVKKHRLKGEI
jgi:UPF0755 protein